MKKVSHKSAEEKREATERRYIRGGKFKSLDLMREYGEDETDKTQNIEEDYITQETIEIVRQAIMKLSEKQQALVRAVYFDEQKIIDIAAELGIKHPSVCGQLRTIEKKLKKLLQVSLHFDL